MMTSHVLTPLPLTLTVGALISVESLKPFVRSFASRAMSCHGTPTMPAMKTSPLLRIVRSPSFGYARHDAQQWSAGFVEHLLDGTGRWNGLVVPSVVESG